MEKQIIKLEKEYWTGMEKHDYETVKKLTSFPCIVAGKKGVQSVDETSFKKMFESGAAYDIKLLDISDVKEQLISENTAIIGYVIELEMPDKTSARCVCTSTWIKENNSWICAMHTETELSEQ